MPQAARLQLFGLPELRTAGGSPVRLRSRKQMGVLVVLALEAREQAVSRERLVELLWEDVDGAKGRHSLAQATSAIRGALGPAALERVGGGIRLRTDLETDLDQVADDFERLPLTEPLREAEWWGGAEFAHWVEAARERLRRAAQEALRAAIARFRQSGESSRVHAAAAALYALDPLSDVAVHAIAERELVNGDLAGAIRLLRRHVERVRDTLGCAPNRDVERLLRRLEAGAHPPVERLPARLASEAPKLRPVVFVGRERELAQLEAEWLQVEQGGLRTCLVVGPGGIGKTSLLRRWAATLTARAYPVFMVTCQEIGSGIPFAALSDLITTFCLDPSASATDPKWLAELSRIHPALTTQYPGIPRPPDAPPESIRLRVAEGLAHLLAAVADGRAIGIVFDDLQFMDGVSREVLHLTSRRLNDHGVFLLCASRTIGYDGRSIPGATTQPLTWHSTCAVSPLDATATRGMLASLSPKLKREGPGIIARIIGISEGNPQFAEMLLADWERYAAASLAAGATIETMPEHWQPPDSMRQAFAKLYADLPRAARHTLDLLAVAGRALALDEITCSLPMQGESLASGIIELMAKGLLRFDGGGICFKNEVHRAYVYYAVTEDTRRLFHAQLGQTLATRAHRRKDIQAELEAASHLSKAGRHSDAATAVLSAGPVAIRRGAPSEAAQALRAVLANEAVFAASTRASLKLLLAEALSSQGRYTECLRVLDSIEAHVLPSQGSRAQAALLTAQALQRTRLGDDRRIEHTTQEAMKLVRAAGDPDLVASITQVAAEVASDLGLELMRHDVLATIETLLTGTARQNAMARALLTRGFCLMMAGEFGSAYDAFGQSTALLDRERLDPELARALNGRAICLLGLGRHAEIIGPIAAGLDICRRLNDAGHRSMLLGNLGLAYEEVGQVDEASICYQMAIDTVPHAENLRLTVISHCNFSHSCVLLGRLSMAADSLAVAEDAARRSQLWRLEALTDYARADLLLATGEAELAWPCVLRAAQVSRGRERAIDTNGKAIRLQLQYVLANEGRKGLLRQLNQFAQSPIRLRPTDSLEAHAFLAWARETGAIEQVGPILWQNGLAVEGLLGPYGTLAAVGAPTRMHRLEVGETPAAMLERVYPRASRALVLPPLSAIGLHVG